ncbi:MAG: YkgJ family cysteine cluster protein [Bacteroidetes bacterium]|nr:YkgJ family cysteine cluster protein [Bacteroidota bacterium]
MDKLIGEWQAGKDHKSELNKKLIVKISKLKAGDINRLAHDFHADTIKKIDCLACANCCTTIPPIVNETDVGRISKFLGIKTARFTHEYLTTDEDGDQVMKKVPCVFLGADNKCAIYKVRPKACREYPHTDQLQFMKNLNLHLVNAGYCPIVYQILEKFKVNL